MHFHLNHDPPHQLEILFLCSSTTNQNATVTVSRFDKIEANFYFLSPRIMNNTAVHPKKKKKKPTYLPNFSTKCRERANRNNFKCGLNEKSMFIFCHKKIKQFSCSFPLICLKTILLHNAIYEPPHWKTNNLHMRKQRRRSASR